MFYERRLWWKVSGVVFHALSPEGSFKVKTFENLVGRKFGRLTVEAPAESSAGGRRWLCRCDCGKSIVVLENNLKRLHTKSCGCIKSPDLTGQVFGKLTVIGRSDKRGKRGNRTTPLWECRCECGAITYKAKDTLTNPELSMCAECAVKYAAERARESAGFVEGTQLAKIRDMTPSAANTSGVRGVYYESKSDRWRAEIKFRQKRYYLGRYKNKEDAIKARKVAEQELFETFLEEYSHKSE